MAGDGCRASQWTALSRLRRPGLASPTFAPSLSTTFCQYGAGREGGACHFVPTADDPREDAARTAFFGWYSSRARAIDFD